MSLPNELFFLDRLRMLRGHELNAHSLDLVSQPEGFKHQFIVNIDKSRTLLTQSATNQSSALCEEIQRPLIVKNSLGQPFLWLLKAAASPQLWSMGSTFMFERQPKSEQPT